MKFALVSSLAVLASAQTNNSSAGSNSNVNCPLQFTSACANTQECGTLNGYPLECQVYGSVKQCVCSKENANCQNSTNIANTIPQFGVCTGGKQCAGSGFKALQTPVRTCSEQLVCIPQYASGNELQSICHTCSSCKQQNKPDATGRLIFNCTQICPLGQGDPIVTIPPVTTAPTNSTKKNDSSKGSGSTAGSKPKSAATSIVAGVATVAIVAIASLF
uniref:Secreted protein n=1 Tax=Thraustotheca clavata TaxID=74557 RepID=A0A0A7CM66_9STRA|nr:secreted protein [Thraustotheca clavata]